MKSWGINLVRVWAHWHEPIYLPDGTLSEPGRTRLIQLAKRLESRGLIFELVLLRPGQLPGQPFALFASDAARLKAVESIASALRGTRNVVFDLYNEHDHGDGPISHRAARALRDKVKASDPARLVTISSTEHHLVSATGEVTEAGAVNLLSEAGADEVAVDLVAAHFPRTNDWAAATGGRIRGLRTGARKDRPSAADLLERGAAGAMGSRSAPATMPVRSPRPEAREPRDGCFTRRQGSSWRRRLSSTRSRPTSAKAYRS